MIEGGGESQLVAYGQTARRVLSFVVHVFRHIVSLLVFILPLKQSYKRTCKKTQQSAFSCVKVSHAVDVYKGGDEY